MLGFLERAVPPGIFLVPRGGGKQPLEDLPGATGEQEASTLLLPRAQGEAPSLSRLPEEGLMLTE